MQTNYENTGMLDMIFENRNKNYGAYALRNSYSNRMSQALLITVTAISLLCYGKYLSDKMKGVKTNLSGPVVIAETTDIELPKPKTEIEPPKPPLPPQQQTQQAQALNTIRDPEMKVTANNQVVDSMPTNEQMQEADPGLTTNLNGNKIGVDGGKGVAQSFTETQPATTETVVRDWAEVMPKFPGGDERLMQFLRNKTVFPDIERDIDIEGKALVRFVVNEDGSISNVKVVKSDSPGFSKEAVRVVGLMPNFIPGTQQGKPVKVQFVLPFQFKLAH